MTKDPHKKNGFTMHSNIAREYIMMEDIATFQSHPWYQTTSAIIDSALHAGERILIHWYLSLNSLLTCQSHGNFPISDGGGSIPHFPSRIDSSSSNFLAPIPKTYRLAELWVPRTTPRLLLCPTNGSW